MIKIIIVFALFINTNAQISFVDINQNILKDNSSTSANTMLNGAGHAMTSKRMINSENSASWVFLRQTMVDFSFTQNFSTMRSKSFKINNFSAIFNSFAWVSQIMDTTLTIGFTLKPLVSANNHIAESAFFNIDSNSYKFNRTIKYQMTLNELKFGVSKQLNPHLFIAANFLYFFGNKTIKNTVTGSTVQNFVIENKTTYEGYNLGADLLYRINSNTFSAGFIMPVKLNEYSYEQSIIDFVVYNQKRAEGTLELPFRLNLGYAHVFENDNKIYADYKFENWKSLPIHGVFLGYESSYNQSAYSDFLSKSSIFGGMSYYNENFKYSGSDPINNFGVSLGMSIPFNGDRNRFNIAFGYQNRSSNGVKSLSENIFKINLGLSIGEWWYLPEIED